VFCFILCFILSRDKYNFLQAFKKIKRSIPNNQNEETIRVLRQSQPSGFGREWRHKVCGRVNLYVRKSRSWNGIDWICVAVTLSLQLPVTGETYSVLWPRSVVLVRVWISEPVNYTLSAAFLAKTSCLRQVHLPISCDCYVKTFLWQSRASLHRCNYPKVSTYWRSFLLTKKVS